MNEYWAPNRHTSEPWLESQALRGTFVALRAILIVATLLGVAGGFAYIYVSGQQKPIILLAGDHRAYRGKPQESGISEEAFKQLAKDVVEAALLRTNTGDIDALVEASVKERIQSEMTGRSPEEVEARLRREAQPKLLEPFVHPAVRVQLDREFNVRSQVQYSQIYAVNELRLIDPSPEQIEVHIRGVMASRNLTSAKRNPVYLACMFRPVPPTAENPLGWMLYGAVRIQEADFFSSELAAQRKRATSLQGTTN